jgi:hypothetical protein
MANLRKKPRRQFRYDAAILIDKETPPITCSISDISDSGARLALQSDDALPDTFILLLTRNSRTRRHCRIVWRSGLSVGVKFSDRES